jgi:hypothetical protein
MFAAAHSINRNTLSNRYYGRTQAAHPENRKLSLDEEKAGVEWVEKRDVLGFPPTHKELDRMAISILDNKEGQQCDRVGVSDVRDSLL